MSYVKWSNESSRGVFSLNVTGSFADDIIRVVSSASYHLHG